MAINPPAWCKNAVPTVRGWADARTGELLKAQPISQMDIDVWHGVKTPAPVPEGYQELDNDFKPVTLTESPTTEEEFVEEVMPKKTAKKKKSSGIFS
jgi:hypothetical protein